jgi:radical SAM-linked protein
MLEAPRTMRIRFQKTGNLQYISHLDLQRTFSRILVRAGLPLWYTKGFNPHIKMVFGMPLPVGCESECEFLDIRIERDMPLAEIKDRLNAELTHELAVEKVYFAERKFTDIAFAAYEYTLTLPAASEVLAEKIRATLSDGPLTFMKKSKSGEREVNVRDFVHAFDVTYADGAIHLAVTLTAGEKNTLTPEAIVTVLKEKLGLFSGDPLQEYYRILRRRVLMADGVSEFE